MGNRVGSSVLCNCRDLFYLSDSHCPKTPQSSYFSPIYLCRLLFSHCNSLLFFWVDLYICFHLLSSFSPSSDPSRIVAHAPPTHGPPPCNVYTIMLATPVPIPQVIAWCGCPVVSPAKVPALKPPTKLVAQFRRPIVFSAAHEVPLYRPRKVARRKECLQAPAVIL